MIKPAAYGCPNCKQATDAEHKGYLCTWCGSVFRYDVPLFTRDDLVRVAIEMALTGDYNGNHADPEGLVAEMLGEVEK